MDKYIGERFGRLVVLDTFKRPNENRWTVCRCDCGTVKVIRVDHLTSGATISCGCSHHDPKNRTHGGSWTRLFKAWSKMRQRCENPSDSGYANYGGRGISVCAEWQRYESFRDWSLANGYADNLTIDRIDNDGPYAPDNCRWTTAARQANNRRTTVWIEAFGERKSMADWAHDPRCSVSYQALNDRLERGMPAEKAITQPVMHPHDYRLGKV